MNKKTNYIAICFLLLGLTIGTVFTDYARQLGALLADASTPNPGHALEEIEGWGTLVRTTGNQTLAGTKTFSSNVVVPLIPTDNTHAASKGYVDSHSGGLPSGGSSGAFLRMASSGPIWDSPLTWAGSTKSVYDCAQIGGTEFNTGATGTICRYPGSTVPAGWTQAANWQRYASSTWGGDACGRHQNSGPATFMNQSPVLKSPGDYAGNRCYDSLWCMIYGGITAAECAAQKGRNAYIVVTQNNINTTSNRVEIGIY